MRLLTLLALTLSHNVLADQRSELNDMMFELDYMINKAHVLQDSHANDPSSVTFNYESFIDQLTTTRNRLAAHLNDDFSELRVGPPQIVDSALTNQ